MRAEDNTSDLTTKNNIPKVSLIVPMYMCEDYVNDLLDNLCGQDFRDTEIICVVDGSPDRTYELVCSYAERDARVQVYETEHKGAGAARNFGLSKARGEYLMFPDADDEYESNYVSRLLDVAERNNADIAMCHYAKESFLLDNKMKHCGYSCLLVTKNRALHPTTKNSYINYISLMPHNKIFKHTLIQTYSLCFSETFSANDVLFCVTSLICAGTIVFIEDHLLTYFSSKSVGVAIRI